MFPCIRQSAYLTFFWTTLFVQIHRHKCLTFWSVDNCPGNLSEVKAATLRLNCSDVNGFRNVYHCLPSSNLSLLVEFCYNRTSGLTEKGNCLVLSNEYINVRQCNHFTRGCPSVPYYYKDMFKFPACTQINKQSSCYREDPSCPPIISSVEATTMPTVHTIGNNMVHILVPVILVVFAVVVLVVIGLVICFWRRYRSFKTDNVFELVRNCGSKKEEENLAYESVNSAIYDNDGVKIRFNNLRACLVKNISPISRPDMLLLKDSLKEIVPVEKLKMHSLERINTFRDLVNFMIYERIFTERDVVIMQYLLRMIGKTDLEQKCVDYATKQKDILCYFDDKRVSDGCTHVELHVNADIENFTSQDSLIETVAAIVDCDPKSIRVVQIRPNNSFIIVIELEKKLAQLLSRKTPQELIRLAEFKIDAIYTDRNVINIAEPGKKEDLEGSGNDTEENERETVDEEKIQGRFEKEGSIQKRMEDMSISQYLSPTVVSTSSISVPGLDSVYHISCVTADRLWVSDDKHLIQTDSCRHEILKRRIEIDMFPFGGSHTVSEDGELLFIDHSHNRVQKMTSDGTITTLIQAKWERLCSIHSSHINGNILVGSTDGMMRYDRTGQLIRDFMEDWKLKKYYPICITENMNGDIWVSDCFTKVVVVDKSGQHRFDYRGQQSQSDFNYDFEPRGICTDILGQVLVCDIYNPSVHLLDQDGQFLCLLLTSQHGLSLPAALCVDDKQNLYLGQVNSNTITVYKYLQETEDKYTSLMESK